MTEVSLIVPVYNAEKSLARCIDSILAQDYENFELLLMDDGSTDQSAAICDAYADRDPRIRVVHKNNTGVSDTRNQGLKLSRGVYIQFLDADDWIAPEATGLLVRAAEEHDAELVVSDFYRVVNQWTSHKGSIDVEGCLNREEFADWMLKSPADYYYGVLWNKLYRRALIEKFSLRMDPALDWCEDFIFNMEYILHVNRIFILRVPIYYYVKTEGSLVGRGMTLGGIVRMKLSVIEYYQDFYKSIYSKADYQERKPEIYRFLVNYSHDDFALPLLPGTEKLGAERVVSLHRPKRSNVWIYGYYENRMFRRAFEAIGKKLELDYRDLCVMMFLHSFGAIENLREAADYLEIPPVGVPALLQKLSLRGLIKMKLGRAETACLTEKAEDVLKEMDAAVQEVWLDCTKGMQKEEKRQLLQLREQSYQNLREKLER